MGAFAIKIQGHSLFYYIESRNQVIRKEVRLGHVKTGVQFGIFRYIVSTIFNCFSIQKEKVISLWLTSYSLAGHTSSIHKCKLKSLESDTFHVACLSVGFWSFFAVYPPLQERQICWQHLAVF